MHEPLLGRLSKGWRSGRLRRWVHLGKALGRFAVTWGKMLFLKLGCFLQGRRLIAIALIEHFGDIVACEPVSRHLRTCKHDGFILWIVRVPYRELLDSNPFIDRVVVVGCLTEWILLRRSRLFDEIVDLHPSMRTCPRCGLKLRKSEGLLGLDINNYYDFGSLLQAFGLTAGLPDLGRMEPRVYIPPSAVERVNSLGLPQEFIVFHGRSNESSRDWTAEKWTALGELIQKSLGVVTIEIGIAPVMADSSPVHRNLCGKTSLLELAEVLRRATVFVGVDSGPAHMANAVGTSGVILIGRYRSFERYLPYSGRYADGSLAELLYANGAPASISLEQVFQALTRQLASTRAHPRKKPV